MMKSSELIGRKVVIAPFNQDAVFTYYRLKQQGVEVIAFFDKDSALHSKQYLGVTICPYIYLYQTAIVVANTVTVRSDYIEEELRKLSYKKKDIVRQAEIDFDISFDEIAGLVDVDEFVAIKGYKAGVPIKREIASVYAKPEEKFDIKFISVDITNKCTLNCRYCCALMPYQDRTSRRNFDMDVTLQSIEKVVNCVDFIPELSVIGGEPLLNENLKHLLAGLNKKKFKDKIGNFLISTNGTIVPDPETIEAIRGLKNHIYIYISSYGQYSRNIYELIKVCNQNGIDVDVCKNQNWTIMCQPFDPRIGKYTEQEAMDNCSRCNFIKYNQFRIMEDKLYKCMFLAFGDSGKVIPQDERNCLNILDGTFSSTVLRDYLNRFQPGRAYCSAPVDYESGNRQLIPVGEQSDHMPKYLDYEDYMKHGKLL